MTVDEFIARARTNRMYSTRAHVDEPYFETLYVRLTRRYIAFIEHWPVLDIASVAVLEAHRGQGRFTQLLDRIRACHPLIHIYVENAIDPRFQAYLERYGFTVVEPRLDPPVYFLPAEGTP